MAIVKNRFYFGPAGDVTLLPPRERGGSPAPSPELYGSLSRSINGTPTMVSYGVKRSWDIRWPWMTETASRTLGRLEAAYRQRIQRRYYLLDTHNTNYLQPDVSACASENLIEDIFAWSAGLPPTRVNTGTFHADLTGHLDGYVTQTMGAIGSLTQTKPRLPVITGSSYLYSGYFAGTGTINLTFSFYDKAGAFISNLLGANIVLTGTTTGTVASLNFPSSSVPANSATYAVGFRAVTATPVVNFNGLMVQYDEASRPAAGWYPGAGGAEVIVGGFTVAYPHLKFRQITAKILEV